MARPKKEVTTISEALDVIQERLVSEVAIEFGMNEINFRSMLLNELQTDEVLIWHTIPTSMEPVIAQLKRNQDAEASVRPMESKAEVNVEDKNEESSQSNRGGGRLTQKKKESLKRQDQASAKLDSGIEKAEQMLVARKGAKNGAKLASIELLAEQTAYNTVKSEGLKRKVAQLIGEVSNDENFDPQELIAELGLNSNADTLENLTSVVNEALGKYDAATQEVISTSWLNGWDISKEMINLDELLS